MFAVQWRLHTDSQKTPSCGCRKVGDGTRALPEAKNGNQPEKALSRASCRAPSWSRDRARGGGEPPGTPQGTPQGRQGPHPVLSQQGRRTPPGLGTAPDHTPRLSFPPGLAPSGEDPVQSPGSPCPRGQVSRDQGWGVGDTEARPRAPPGRSGRGRVQRGAGGAVAPESSAPPVLARPLPRARPALRIPSASRRPNRPLLSPGFGRVVKLHAARSRAPLPALPGTGARPGRTCILMRGGAGAGPRGRGGLAPARAGTHRGGRCDCEVALTHVPGFLSREGGGSGGGARAGLGSGGGRLEGWRGRSWCPNLSHGVPFSLTSPPSTRAAPPEIWRLRGRGAAAGARLLPLPPA